nr:immunoglobulin heavy chain junction region [Macaca mulatta]MPN72948.1 immunoglobulin heavy chain junction region [Macaca mulatta]MPN73147.1 immunoglobulin heavy chain junction region [Macaca mulatta]MPN74408.1 immunoglobulin heavy chain junction region [Macaca mulatta]MPN74854.1 immunoglobulin heavy chain junction region [Macaca mulatta]
CARDCTSTICYPGGVGLDSW